ncbi:glycosyl hydrolase family 28-related protein [Brenneria goodwinii]|uniref:glycosyl hydrolase family 28-related protein n=1 Tax=Brenneria goodwinii TaxID=1109412 RepID=UPI0036EF4522
MKCIPTLYQQFLGLALGGFFVTREYSVESFGTSINKNGVSTKNYVGDIDADLLQTVVLLSTRLRVGYMAISRRSILQWIIPSAILMKFSSAKAIGSNTVGTDSSSKVVFADSTLDMTSGVGSKSYVSDALLRANLADSTGAELIGYQLDAKNTVLRTLADKAAEVLSVKDFGAIGDGKTDDHAAIQHLLDYVATRGGGVIVIPYSSTPYCISDTIKLYNDTILICQGWLKVIADTSFDAAVSGVPGACNWRVYGLKVDANHIPAQGGLYLRRNNCGCYADVVQVINASHDKRNSGGRAVCFEAGVKAKLYGARRSSIGVIIAKDCYNALTVGGGSDIQQTPTFHVGTVLAENCETVVNLFGNEAGYPHPSSAMSGVIDTVVAYNCGASTTLLRRHGIINSDRGSNVTFGKIVVANTAEYTAGVKYPPYSLLYGDFYSVRVLDASVEAELVVPVAFFRYAEQDRITDDNFTTLDCDFRIRVRGSCLYAANASLSSDEKVQNTHLNIHIDGSITGSTILPPTMQGKTTVFLRLWQSSQRARIEGPCSRIAETGPTQYVGLSVDMYAWRLGSVAYDAPSLAPGTVGSTLQITTVAGALVGESVTAKLSVNPKGVNISAWVSATDTVTWYVYNPPGNPSGTVDLGSATVHLYVHPVV